eukprot:gene3989-7245_t
MTTKTQSVGCLIWQNSYIHIEKENKVVHISVKTKQKNGWIGIGALKTKNDFSKGSFILAAYLPNNFLPLKNHTIVSRETKKIWNQKFEDIWFNQVDGIMSFSFKINNTDLAGKNHFFLASYGHQFQNNSLLPKHDRVSEYMFYDVNSTQTLPECNMEMNLPGRFTARHWSIFYLTSLATVFVIILLVIFRNDQPLKSRFIGPIVLLISIYFNMFGEYLLDVMNFEQTTKLYCEITIILSYLTTEVGLTIPMIMLLRKFIVKINNKSNETRERFETKFSMILKFLSLQYCYVIFPVIWGFFFFILMIVIYAINDFKCSSVTAVSIRYGHFGCLVIVVVLTGCAIVIDLISNIRNILKYRWKKYLLLDDPFHYRLDMIWFVFVVPLVPIWALAPIPYLFKGIVVDFILLFTMCGCGLQALVITIFKKLFAQSKKFTSKNTFLTMETVLKNDNLLKMFINFCELEWSSENIYFKLDALEYKRTKTISERKILTETMKERYLLFSASILELNVREHFIHEVVKKINSELYYDHLFDDLEISIDTNLLDTLQRFKFSKHYDAYLLDLKTKEQSLGL